MQYTVPTATGEQTYDTDLSPATVLQKYKQAVGIHLRKTHTQEFCSSEWANHTYMYYFRPRTDAYKSYYIMFNAKDEGE